MKHAKQFNVIYDDIPNQPITEPIRLNKYLAQSGQYSRRQADRLIEENKVIVDGVLATMGQRVTSAQHIAVNGIEVTTFQRKHYILLNKPIGVTCTTDTAIDGNLTTYMQFPDRIFPVGRLDKQSFGLLLLTNDGDIVNKILRCENNHEKEYIVSVHKKISNADLHAMTRGVSIYNPSKNEHQQTKPTTIARISDLSFRIVLKEGLNRQIRRMCTAHNYQVTSLERVRIMHLIDPKLPIGTWRYLSTIELKEMFELIN